MEQGRKTDKRYNAPYRRGRHDSIYSSTNGNSAFGHMKGNLLVKTKVKDLNLEYVRPPRAGVVLYIWYKGELYLGWGTDAVYHDITDFGGQIRYKWNSKSKSSEDKSKNGDKSKPKSKKAKSDSPEKGSKNDQSTIPYTEPSMNTDYDSDVIQGALREFNEETLNIFEPLSPADLSESTVIYDNKNLIIFMRIDLEPDEVSRIFVEKFKAHKTLHPDSKPEVCGITWLTWSEFKNSMANHDMYSRVRHFLSKARDFKHLL